MKWTMLVSLVIPASSAPIDCVFSVSGYISCGQGNGLNDKNLEREVLVKKNKKYLYLYLVEYMHLKICECTLGRYGAYTSFFG